MIPTVAMTTLFVTGWEFVLEPTNVLPAPIALHILVIRWLEYVSQLLEWMELVVERILLCPVLDPPRTCAVENVYLASALRASLLAMMPIQTIVFIHPATR